MKYKKIEGMIAAAKFRATETQEPVYITLEVMDARYSESQAGQILARLWKGGKPEILERGHVDGHYNQTRGIDYLSEMVIAQELRYKETSDLVRTEGGEEVDRLYWGLPGRYKVLTYEFKPGIKAAEVEKEVEKQVKTKAEPGESSERKTLAQIIEERKPEKVCIIPANDTSQVEYLLKAVEACIRGGASVSSSQKDADLYVITGCACCGGFLRELATRSSEVLLRDQGRTDPESLKPIDLSKVVIAVDESSFPIIHELDPYWFDYEDSRVSGFMDLGITKETGREIITLLKQYVLF